jgi:hypothetical protein
MPIPWWSHLIWLLALTAGSFLVSWLFTDLFRLARSVYVGILAGVTAAFLYGYLSWINMDWRVFLSHQWIWGLVGAVIAGPLLIVLVAQVARRSQSPVLTPAPRPKGLRLVGALVWEGIVYGTAEGLLLSVLPVLMIWQTFSALGWTQSWAGAILMGMIALVASLIVIVVHHLGYREFRGPLVAGAAMTCGILSVAYLLTVNPLAAVGGHIIMHTGAILRGTELPPHQEKVKHAAASMLPLTDEGSL